MAEDKRINIGITSGRYEMLQRYCDAMGAKVSTEVSYWIAQKIDELKRSGEIPEKVGMASPDNEFPVDEQLEVLKGFMNSLINTRDRNGFSLAEIAEILGRSEGDREVIALVEQLRGNGKAKKEKGAV